MGKVITRFCVNCNAQTEHEWQVEPEDEGNPAEFYLMCLNCMRFTNE